MYSHTHTAQVGSSGEGRAASIQAAVEAMTQAAQAAEAAAVVAAQPGPARPMCCCLGLARPHASLLLHTTNDRKASNWQTHTHTHGKLQGDAHCTCCAASNNQHPFDTASSPHPPDTASHPPQPTHLVSGPSIGQHKGVAPPLVSWTGGQGSRGGKGRKGWQK